MIFRPTRFKESFEIRLEPKGDERGYFMRAFAAEEFAAQGTDFKIAHVNRGYNRRKGTTRGLHYQATPKEEAKLVQVIRGTIFDLIVDMRPDSPTYKQWQGFELSDEKKNMLLVPKGF